MDNTAIKNYQVCIFKFLFEKKIFLFFFFFSQVWNGSYFSYPANHFILSTAKVACLWTTNSAHTKNFHSNNLYRYLLLFSLCRSYTGRTAPSPLRPSEIAANLVLDLEAGGWAMSRPVNCGPNCFVVEKKHRRSTVTRLLDARTTPTGNSAAVTIMRFANTPPLP